MQSIWLDRADQTVEIRNTSLWRNTAIDPWISGLEALLQNSTALWKIPSVFY